MSTKIPVMKTQCATCPFRQEGWTEVRPLLMHRALNEATPICHSTGDGALSKTKLHAKDHACRGARNLQLEAFAAIGFIEAATDEAWEKKCREMNL